LGYFRPWVLTEDKFIKVFTEQMSDELLHVSDELRYPEPVAKGLLRVFDPAGPHEIWEIGDDGILVFRDIADGFKCQMSWIIWNRDCWGKGVVREAKSVIEEFAKRKKLFKIETQTADERVVKLARLLGFETEGYRTESFLRNGVRYGITLLGRTFAREEE
jgi:RimJ/RimL family protein N-acetyltransferase